MTNIVAVITTPPTEKYYKGQNGYLLYCALAVPEHLQAYVKTYIKTFDLLISLTHDSY